MARDDHPRQPTNVQYPIVQRPRNTRITQLRDPHGPRPTPVTTKPTADWRKDLVVSIRLDGLPPSTSTLGLWKNFSNEGEMITIDIFENRDGNRDGGGRIRFSPPPKRDFWSGSRGQYPITGEDGARYLIRVKLDSSRPRMGFQSPIKKYVFYNSQMRINAWALDFGLMQKEDLVISLRKVEPTTSDPYGLSFVVNLQKLRIEAKFRLTFLDARHHRATAFNTGTKPGQRDRENSYMFHIPFGQLRTIKKLDYQNESFFRLLIALDSPPQFYRKRVGAEAGHTPEVLTWSEFDTWYRQTDVVYDPYRLATAKVALHKEQPEIDIGRWKTYVWTFQKSSYDAEEYRLMEQALLDFNIEIVDSNAAINWDPRPADLWGLIGPPALKNAAAELLCLETSEDPNSLPFEVRYQLEVCISREFLNEHNITKEFVKSLSDLSRADPAAARNLLEYVAEQGRRVFDPMAIFQDREALAFSPRTEIPHYCAQVRKATITPTTIYFSSPTVETTNRVLRRYAEENQDGRFLRVQFTDETFEGKINSSAKQNRNDEIFTRVYRTLFNGIQIGDRNYEFLAFGNSQFRENGAYFFCPSSNLSCEDIRSWMGSFAHIDVVAKYAARLGQCFSTTRAINGLSNPTLVKIDDITRNGFCFTDGVGKISSFMAQMISTDLGLQGSIAPSAFQFRLGGCKGMLVVWPDVKEKEVHIRHSQQKFAATYNGLEIIKCAQFSCATLNRQTITILSALGVPDKVFLDMLSEQLANYQAAMVDDELAVRLLCRYVDDTKMTINIATMIRNGFTAHRDPFVMSLLHLWRAWSIKLLKEKAKIIVENGAFVFGCVDETGSLRGYTKPSVGRGENFPVEKLPQIFIQVSDKADPGKYNVIKGICLVGRNPSLHPGDLRVVEAVNVPALHHLRDVVVFPQTGDRDIPSMCSGGDLDGDDFFVLWDKGLQPPEWNCEPMNFSAPVPKVRGRPVRITDLMKFFVVFMKNNALPTIAHAHLAQADYLRDSVKDPRCLELAGLHSKAVDYVKTGQPAEMPKRLRPQKWPHFMEKRHKPNEMQYISDKILGQLYDRVESIKFIPLWEERFDVRILQAYKLEDSLLTTARRVKSQYDTAMRRILANQGVQTEFEIWSTFVLSKPRVGSDYMFQEAIANISDALKDQFRAVCIEKAGGRDFTYLGPFVAGMYKVTKEEMDIALAECRATKIVGGREVPKRKMEPRSMPLISFPWLFEKELGRIATGVDPSAAIEELGFLPLGRKNEGASRRRQGFQNNGMDDFVQQENGVIIHRGEELDLFRSDINDDSDESYMEDHSILDDDEYPYTLRKPSRDVLVDTDSSYSGDHGHLSGTGVEEVVTPAKLDGLFHPEGLIQPRQKSSIASQAFVGPVGQSQWKDESIVRGLAESRDGGDGALEETFGESKEEPDLLSDSPIGESTLEKLTRMGPP